MVANDQKCRVLIVDDEKNIANTLATIFSASGYDARAAYSAEEALEIISNWRPDLAIIDVYLPRMNGIDLAILLKTNLSDCRIALFSGQSGTSDLLAAATEYSFNILAKPVHPIEMLRVASCLLGSPLDNEPEILAS